ncbi:MAG: hypothetical protein KKF56_01080, partial [Nanoarchaeota archaeon]|nr:hypothetical protein [Nanoarchaeota archaeon]
MQKRGVLGIVICIMLFSLISVGFADSDVPGDDVTCDAFWEGYVYDSESGYCEFASSSGCDDPYKYHSMEECERANSDDSKDDLICLQCGDGCMSAERIAAVSCLEPTKEIKCGVENRECVVIEEEEGGDDGEKENICHIPSGNEDNAQTIEVSKSAIDDHLSHGDYFGKCFEDDDETLGSGGASTGIFGGIDRFLDSIFQSDIGNMEERAAEIMDLIRDGRIEEAKEMMEYYSDAADKLMKEVSPEEKEEAEKIANKIRNTIRELENSLSEEDKIKFKKDIQGKANKVRLGAEIASKIKELCEELSDIDPVEYSRMCSAGDDSPRWQRDLDDDLTDEQREEVENFADIMSECFKTSGQTCRCEEIPFTDFASSCSKAASLAKACEVGGDKSACDDLDNLEMPRLPDHLQKVFERMEEGMMDEKFDMHFPRECEEAGISENDPDAKEKCKRIMIETGAPEECKQALLDSGCDSESECRKICDEIMMKQHAPDCVEKGITDPEECKKFMDSFRRDDNFEDGPRMDFNCKEIEDPMKRLDCYDKAGSQTKSRKGFDDNYEGNCMTDKDWKDKKSECRGLYGEHAGDEPIYGDSGEGYECVVDAKCVNFGEGKVSWEDIKKRERECASKCESENKPWDFRNGNCVCKEGDYQGGKEGDNNRGPGCNDCSSQCPAGANTDCVNDRCVCGDVPDTGPQYGEGEGPGQPGDYDNNGEPPSSGGDGESGSSSSGDGESESSSGGDSGEGSESGGSSSSGEGGSSSSSSGEGESSSSSSSGDGGGSSSGGD